MQRRLPSCDRVCFPRGLVGCCFFPRRERFSLVHFKWKAKDPNIYVVRIHHFPKSRTEGEGKGWAWGRIVRDNQICILVRAFFKGHTSIPWIQISMEKSLSKQFCRASPPASHLVRQTRWLCRGLCVKGYFTPCPLTNG